jgi:MFS family permease
VDGAVLQRHGRHRDPRAGLADDPGLYSSIDAKEAAGFVGLLSLANMIGRLVWSSTSDVIGRKPIYMGYLGIGTILYFILASSGTASLALFVAVTAVILSFYGGGFATIPAYLKDLFGGLEVGAIHGRLLTAWSCAGVAGPLIVNRVADSQTAAGKEGADLYELSLYIMVGVLIVGFVANLLLRPVAERHHVRRRDGRERRPAEPRLAYAGRGARHERRQPAEHRPQLSRRRDLPVVRGDLRPALRRG